MYSGVWSILVKPQGIQDIQVISWALSLDPSSTP